MSGPVNVARKLQAVTDDLDYTLDYSQASWLAPGDSIFSSVWTAAPLGLTLHDPSFSATIATVWATGGTVGTTYVLTNTVTTVSNPARVVHRTIELTIQ